jgi:FHS family glucose/mannose:H+ symporter-like MFS transporter
MENRYNKIKVFIAACIGMSFFGISIIVLGSILPILSDKFALNTAQTTSLVAFLPIGMLIGSVIFGPIVDQRGYKGLLILSSLLVLAGLEGVAFLDSVFLVQISIFLIGFGGGILNGETNALVSVIYEDTKRNSMLSFLGAFYGLGALGIPVLLSAFLKSYPLHQIFTGIGVVMFLLIIFCAVIKYPEASQKQGFPISAGFRLLKRQDLLLLSFILFFQSGIEGVVNNWTVFYLTDFGFLEHSKALLTITAMTASLTAARLILVSLLKRFSQNRILNISILVAIAGVLLMIQPVYITSLIGMMLVGFGIASTFPIVLGIIGTKYPTMSGTAFSIALVFALLGNNILNSVTGIWLDKSGAYVYPLILVICFLIILLIYNRVKKLNHTVVVR